MADPKPLTRQIEWSKRKEKSGKEHVPEDPTSEQSSSDSSLIESDFNDDRKCNKSRSKSESDSADNIKYRKSKIKICDKKKNNQKRTKQDLSDSPSGDSDYYDNIDYKNKRHTKRKSSLEKGPYQIMRKIDGKVADNSV